MLYPRPQFERKPFLVLDGEWELMTESVHAPIQIPFSPEAELSGFPRQDSLIEHLSYSREFSLPHEFEGKRIILNFIAVDQCCKVFVNDALAFEHKGGYLPFSGDITGLLNLEGSNSLRVECEDLLDATGFGYGKQSRSPHGIWYTAQSGIWQSVWLEAVPLSYITSVRITPDVDSSSVSIMPFSEFDDVCAIEIDGMAAIKVPTNRETSIPIPSPHLWSPEDPYLYRFTMKLGEDEVRSYFGMRKFSVEGSRMLLNNKPYFHSGVLDQGYYKGGLYTPPDDEAMKNDILLMKSMGFNTLRKHMKVENPRWYYHCDAIGMLVWQDLPSGGKAPYNRFTIQAPVLLDFHLKDNHYSLFSRDDAEGRRNCLAELDEMVRTLHNCPSIAMWVPFNEGWGQFDSTEAAGMVRRMDASRPIDNASGWHDQGTGQFRSLHVYFKPYLFHKDRRGRAVILSEFGGYNCRIPGHSSDVNFGYAKQSSTKQLEEAITKLYQGQIIPARRRGLCAAIYTQLSDVETELNGLVTYDRQVVKVSPELMRKLNQELIGL
ncbi:MAG: glycoside hydrolase family 2 protein [Sphaerochaetaceae bacterium]